MRRVKRRSTADRPMLQGDPAQRIAHLMAERYPVYAEADVTVMSRDVAHETIVNEIIAALAEPLGLAAPAIARPPMTAPAATGEPTVVKVALGDRAYDIVIGRGLLAELGTRIAALKPGAAAAIVTDETVAARHLGATQAALDAAGIRVHADRRSARARRPRAGTCCEHVCDAAARCAHRAQRRRRRARRRRRRRSCGLCGGDPAPRPRRRAGADHAAGAGRFLGRRQDRRSIRATARTWSARSISRSW